jgi:hypothetical protein
VRRLLALLLVVAVAPGTWLRSPPKPENLTQELTVRRLPLPEPAVQKAYLGSFELEGIWQLDSPHDGFGGYSALLATGDGQLLALSDLGYYLRFSAPGARQSPPRIDAIYPQISMLKANRDCEAATRDPSTGAIWLAWENRNAITRHDSGLEELAAVTPQAMRDWSSNLGPEAMVRLRDGRFVVLSESFSAGGNEGLLFADDPTLGGAPRRFTFRGAKPFRPVDMAQLPDGRVLVLMRRLVWPMPPRFTGRIAIADPAELRAGHEWPARPVASLDSSLPVDNFEGMAIEPRGDGRLTVWLISDDNRAVSQRTLLWKLAVDPARL